MQQEKNKIVGAWKCNKQAEKCNGGMASSVHGLLDCILGHGKPITKLMICTFVNGLRLVQHLFSNLQRTLSSVAIVFHWVSCLYFHCDKYIATLYEQETQWKYALSTDQIWKNWSYFVHYTMFLCVNFLYTLLRFTKNTGVAKEENYFQLFSVDCFRRTIC